MTDLRDVFADGDYEMVVEAMYDLRARKQEALKEAGQHPMTAMFTARDFGIPKIDAILKRLDAEPSAATAAEMAETSSKIASINVRIVARVENPNATFELAEALDKTGGPGKFKHLVADAVAYAADGNLEELKGLVLGDVFQHDLPEMLSAPGHIGLRLEGGVVQSVFTDRPMDVIVIDYDTEGCDPQDVFDMPQVDGSTSGCLVGSYPAAVMPDECRRIKDALNARDNADESLPEGMAP